MNENTTTSNAVTVTGQVNVLRHATWHRRAALSEAELKEAFQHAEGSRLFAAILDLLDSAATRATNDGLRAANEGVNAVMFHLGGLQGLIDLRAELEERAQAQPPE